LFFEISNVALEDSNTVQLRVVWRSSRLRNFNEYACKRPALISSFIHFFPYIAIILAFAVVVNEQTECHVLKRLLSLKVKKKPDSIGLFSVAKSRIVNVYADNDLLQLNDMVSLVAEELEPDEIVALRRQHYQLTDFDTSTDEEKKSAMNGTTNEEIVVEVCSVARDANNQFIGYPFIVRIKPVRGEDKGDGGNVTQLSLLSFRTTLWHLLRDVFNENLDLLNNRLLLPPYLPRHHRHQLHRRL
jgi:hypothetical protein